MMVSRVSDWKYILPSHTQESVLMIGSSNPSSIFVSKTSRRFVVACNTKEILGHENINYCKDRKNMRRVHLVVTNAQYLPFKSNIFNLIAIDNHLESFLA